MPMPFNEATNAFVPGRFEAPVGSARSFLTPSTSWAVGTGPEPVPPALALALAPVEGKEVLPDVQATLALTPELLPEELTRAWAHLRIVASVADVGSPMHCWKASRAGTVVEAMALPRPGTARAESVGCKGTARPTWRRART